jgi:hypothetical protein
MASGDGDGSWEDTLSERDGAYHHGGLWLQQQGAHQAVEARVERFDHEIGMGVTVTHLPSGTNKWNRIEHRLFTLLAQKVARQAASEPRMCRPNHTIGGLTKESFFPTLLEITTVPTAI